MLSKTIYNARWWITAFLVAVMPFHAFIVTWLKLPGLQIWREVLILVVFLLVVAEYALERKLPKFDALDWLICAYVLMAIVWLPLQQNKILWLLGFRLDTVPFILLLVIKHSKWEKIDKLIKIFFVSAGIVLTFGILQSVLLPQAFLTNFGYGSYQGEWQSEQGIPSCQYLEHTNKVCRAISTFGGPTRYGTYLLLVIGFITAYLITSHNLRTAYCQVLTTIGILALTNIVLTFSRSIWLGGISMAIFGLLFYVRKKYRVQIVLFGVGLFFCAIVGLWITNLAAERPFSTFPPPFIKTMLLRQSSTGEHVKLLKQGLNILEKNPLGMGLGTAGPASVRYNKLLTENWYLQIALEMGIQGLVVFTGVLVSLLRKLLEHKQNTYAIGLTLSLIGIAVAGLFTHSFEETSTVMTIMIFGGIFLTLSDRPI